MKRIYKYKVEPKSRQLWIVTMPAGSKILDIQSQYDPVYGGDISTVCWAEVDLSVMTNAQRRFYVMFTGEEVPDNAIYLKTVQDGSLVYHFYYDPREF